MTSFLLKIIGIFTMFCDHFGDAILKNFSFFNVIGRIAFPLFAFQISQGYIHTKNLKKFMFRLLIFALISQIPFTLFLYSFPSTSYNDITIFSFTLRMYSLNVGFTMLLGILAILAFDKINNKFLGLGISLLVASFAQFLNVDYGAFGVLFILIIYIFKDKKYKLWMNLSIIFLVCIFYFLRYLEFPYISITNYYLPVILFTCIPLVFINFYNGKQGPKLKYLFYVFYPVHLLILYLVS